MMKTTSILGASIAEVDEINCEEAVLTPKSAKDTLVRTEESADAFVYLSESSSQEEPGSDDDEIDDLYYNQKMLAKQLNKIKNLPSKLTYLVQELNTNLTAKSNLQDSKIES